MRRLTLALAAVLMVLALPVLASAQSTNAEQAEVAAVVSAYHEALTTGDSTAALALLADDVTILESGGMEDKDHYRSGHLAGDMRFAQAVPRERGTIQVQVMGDVAWTWSTSITEGRMGDREINAQGAELMVLARSAQGWRIKAIHWSSRPRR